MCDPDHPALKEFPTDFHSDWQWRNLLDQSEALVIDNSPPNFRPIIQFVPDFNTNHKLSALMEARVSKGAIIGKNVPWTGHNNLDQVITLKEGFDYNIDGSIFRDHNQSIWFKDHLLINVRIPVDFKGSFFVYLLDQYDEGRAAHIFFCGQDKGPLSRYDRKGVWLKYEVTPDMAQSGQLVFDARTMKGPNVTVHRLILIPEN